MQREPGEPEQTNAAGPEPEPPPIQPAYLSAYTCDENAGGNAAPKIGAHFDQTIASEIALREESALRELSESDFHSPPGRRIVKPVLLFVATCLSTFWAGAMLWEPLNFMGNWHHARIFAIANWQTGLIYMAAVIGILLMHEMGHFIQTVRYGVPASLPYFIPVPVLTTGTMGAVIGMEGSRADRRQLFDIGISGPLAGLVVALPVIWFGILNAKVATPHDIPLGDPLIFKLLTHWLRPELASGVTLSKNNPLLMAGWVGMLITGLNMLPISQLDGGHVIYGLFGKKSHLIARAFLIAAILFVIIAEQYNWVVMMVLVILLGVDHPPTRDDDERLGPLRWTLGFVSLIIPILCFTPFILL